MTFDRTAGNGDPRAGVFGRVSEDLDDPLTPEQVEALPHGAKVVIVWSGGNGPHPYWIWRFPDGGATYARSEMETEDETLRWHGDPIHFVGAEHFHTRVWLATDPIGPDGLQSGRCVEGGPTQCDHSSTGGKCDVCGLSQAAHPGRIGS